MSDDQCGHPTASGEPCQHPTTDDGDPDRCWIDSHNDDAVDPNTQPGRPRLLDDQRKQQIIYTAVNSGLSIEHQANLAQVSPDTLRRALCCVKTPRTPELDIQGRADRYEKMYGYDLSEYSFSSDYPKDKVLRNCVHPDVGKAILESALNSDL